jgi:transcriptional regulator with XRE-family HTH domain
LFLDHSQNITTMKITGLLTDDAVLAELGARIAGRRVALQLTQAAVAEQAGIAKRTLERMEAGLTSQLATLVRVLRVLDAASELDGLIPESGPRPMDLLKRKSKIRQRASKPRAPKPTGKQWRWDDKP